MPLGTRVKANWIMLRELARFLVRRKEPMPWPEMSIANIGGAFSNKLAKATPGNKIDATESKKESAPV